MSLEWTICITRDHLWGVGQASTWLVGSIHKELCACQGGTPPYPSHCTWLVGFATCKTWPTTHHSTSRGKYHIYISKIHVYTEYQNTHIMAESSHHQTCNMFIVMWRTYRNRIPHPLPKSSPCPRTLIANSNTLLIRIWIQIRRACMERKRLMGGWGRWAQGPPASARRRSPGQSLCLQQNRDAGISLFAFHQLVNQDAWK
jgi:hypothetical protein